MPIRTNLNAYMLTCLQKYYSPGPGLFAHTYTLILNRFSSPGLYIVCTPSTQITHYRLIPKCQSIAHIVEKDNYADGLIAGQ